MMLNNMLSLCDWDPYLECLNHEIESIQNKAVHFLSTSKEGKASQKLAENLHLDTLVNLLLRLLSSPIEPHGVARERPSE